MPKFIYPSFTGTGANLGLGTAGDTCAHCHRDLDAHLCRFDPRGVLICLLCAADALPDEVKQTLEEMEREYGAKHQHR